jgi:hypothetical protein
VPKQKQSISFRDGIVVANHPKGDTVLQYTPTVFLEVSRGNHQEHMFEPRTILPQRRPYDSVHSMKRSGGWSLNPSDKEEMEDYAYGDHHH